MQNIKMPRYHWSVVARSVNTAIALGLTATVGTAAIVNAAPADSSPSTTSTQTTTLPDGVYLYGQAAKPDELGKGYFVFEAKKGHVVGALYMPRSSFDCAAGRFNANQLALTVTNSYDRTTNPFEIAVDRTSTVASSTQPTPAIGLQGFYKLDQVSDNDLRMLNVCKADLQGPNVKAER